jgi:predicted nucleic acid-binding protein
MTGSAASTLGMIDTNVLIYAADPAAGDKKIRAQDLIQALADADRLAVSVQVLNEFYTVATRPHRPPSLSHDEASQIVRDLAASASVLSLTAVTTLRALEAIPRHGFSFWDALIWAVARENNIPVIYTEDFQHGRDVEGVLFRNPFATGP